MHKGMKLMMKQEHQEFCGIIQRSVHYNFSTLIHVLVVLVVSHVQFFATPWTVACQAPLSREFSRQEYWSGLPLPTPGDLINPGIKPVSHKLLADSLPSETQGANSGTCFKFS